MTLVYKLLILILFILLPISIGACFYNSVILNEINPVGVSIEKSEGNIFVFFFHNGEEFSFNSTAPNDGLESIIQQSSDVLLDAGHTMDSDLKELISTAYFDLETEYE